MAMIMITVSPPHNEFRRGALSGRGFGRCTRPPAFTAGGAMVISISSRRRRSGSAGRQASRAATRGHGRDCSAPLLALPAAWRISRPRRVGVGETMMPMPRHLSTRLPYSLSSFHDSRRRAVLASFCSQRELFPASSASAAPSISAL